MSTSNHKPADRQNHRRNTEQRSRLLLTIVAALYGLLGGVLIAAGEVRPGVLTVTFGLWLLYLKDDPELGFALSLIMLGIDIGVLHWDKWATLAELDIARAGVLIAKAVLMFALMVLYVSHRLRLRPQRSIGTAPTP